MGGREDRLAPWAQAKLWALHAVNEELGLGLEDGDMAELVKKGDGTYPTKQAVQQFRARFRSDPDWYPGKGQAEPKKPGPKTLFTKAKQAAVASSAMALKASGEEPSAGAVVQRCPKAAFNPQTGEPFCERLILRVFRTLCFDVDADHPWDHDHPYSRNALSPEHQEERLAWAKELIKVGKQLGHGPGWWRRHVVWFDPCHTVLPGSAKKAFDVRQASYGKAKRWVSANAKGSSRNLRAKPYALQQTSWGDQKVYYFIGLARATVFVEVMPDGWQPNGDGTAEFVKKLPEVLARVVDAGDAFPRVVMTDRGPGFYQGSTGHIVNKYNEALEEEGFRPFAGVDASSQPPDVPDVLVHETVASWLRVFLRKRPFKKPGSMVAQRKDFVATLADFVAEANEKNDVASLCESFPARLQKLVKKKGDRLGS